MSPLPQKEENPALIEAWKQYRAAERDYIDAKDALEWLADEWKHLWPLAPEELLGTWNMHKQAWDSAEKDILGKPLLRDTSVLTMRLSAQQRAEAGQQCFAVSSAAELQKSLEFWREWRPRGRTEKALARNRVAKAKALRRVRRQLRLALRYEADIAGVRKAAGVEAAKARFKTSEENLDRLADRVSRELPFTLYGVRLQADVLAYTFERYRITTRRGGIFGETMRLVCNVLDATEHLDGSWSTSGAQLTPDGGAA